LSERRGGEGNGEESRGEKQAEEMPRDEPGAAVRRGGFNEPADTVFAGARGAPATIFGGARENHPGILTNPVSLTP